jgi:cytochrome P450
MYSKVVRAPLSRVLRRLPSADAQVLALVAGPQVRADPWAVYRRLRETRPVYRSRLGAWIVASHAGVAAVLRHPAVSVDESRSKGSDNPTPDAFSGLLNRTMLFRDPPDHDRLRRLVSRAFTPRRIEELRPRVEALTARRLDALASRGGADLLADLAYPLTVDVICELLGIPSGARAHFPTWAVALAARMDIEAVRTPHIEQQGNIAATEFAAFIDGLITDPRRRVRGGLIDSLVAAEEEGERLTHDEVISTCALLVFAGHETTANLLGNGVLTLLRHPDQLRELRAGNVSMSSAVEELLRYDGPVQFTQRIALADLDIDGHTIPAGEVVALLIGSANRDEAVFADAQCLDLARDPNPHLALSFGIHACLGAALARMEVAVVLAQLIERCSELRLAGRPRWRDTFVVRGLRSLPITWGAS